MRRFSLCLAILLTLPCAAYAEPSSAAGASADAAAVLDLSFDPDVAATPGTEPVVPPAVATPPSRDIEGPFSVGLDIKSRREIGSPAARATADRPGPPTLADQVEDIVQRSAIGVTGTYRF